MERFVLLSSFLFVTEKELEIACYYILDIRFSSIVLLIPVSHRTGDNHSENTTNYCHTLALQIELYNNKKIYARYC